MRHVLFLLIQSTTVSYDPYFLRKRNAVEILINLSPKQKITEILQSLPMEFQVILWTNMYESVKALLLRVLKDLSRLLLLCLVMST